jgi:ribonucleoside-diphosphate reductase beta chain
MSESEGPRLILNPESRSYRYYRNAVERHWNPHEIDLSADADRIADLDEAAFEGLRRTLALFGAGEQAVTDDLAPLAVVLDDPDDQAFVSTQLYEEAKHTDFFDRYWREVVTRAEERRGTATTSPGDDRWFSEAYADLFDRNEAAMERLLVEDTPESRASAYCHYHLIIEGVLAQTGYYGVQRSFSGEFDALPRLPGLVEGFSQVRADEGRHVGFGMAKLKAFVAAGDVTAPFLHDQVGDLLALTQEIVAEARTSGQGGVSESDLVAYAAERHGQRMRQVTNASEAIPDVAELVALDEEAGG